MQFLYHKFALDNKIFLEKEEFLHLKVRRIKENEIIKLRNLKDDYLYSYKIENIKKNSCELILIDKILLKSNKSNFSIALSIIDNKILEKTLPFLNELGLDKLILVYAKFSQKSFKIDLNRLHRILISSCEQCGRSYLMDIEFFDDLYSFLDIYPQAIMVDFTGKKSSFEDKDKLYFIGPEGGFDDEERKLFKNIIKLKSPHILRSQTACIALVAKNLI